MSVARPSLQLWLALLPLAAFWAVEAWWGSVVAIVVSMVLVSGEVIGSAILRGSVSGLTWITAVTVVGLGGLSLLGDDPRYVLWTPVVGDVVMAGALGLSVWQGRPLLVVAAEEQDEVIPDDLRAGLGAATVRGALVLLLHGVITALATTASRDVWFAVSGLGQYVALGLWLGWEMWRGVGAVPVTGSPTDAPAPPPPPAESGPGRDR